MLLRPSSKFDAPQPSSMLDGLGLAAEERRALAQQGSVVTEVRGNCTYFKLRYRCKGRQRSRYLGADPERAAQVRAELGRLQQTRKLELSLARTARDSSQCLRAGKGATRGVLAKYGYRYHGHAIRRVRAVQQAELSQQNPNQEDRIMEPNSSDCRELQPSPQAAGNLTHRIDELQQAAIAAPGDLFVLKLFTAQLVSVSQQLYQLIGASLNSTPSLDDASPRLRTAIDLHFKVVRQGERNVRLASELEKAAALKLEAHASEKT